MKATDKTLRTLIGLAILASAVVACIFVTQSYRESRSRTVKTSATQVYFWITQFADRLSECCPSNKPQVSWRTCIAAWALPSPHSVDLNSPWNSESNRKLEYLGPVAGFSIIKNGPPIFQAITGAGTAFDDLVQTGKVREGVPAILFIHTPCAKGYWMEPADIPFASLLSCGSDLSLTNRILGAVDNVSGRIVVMSNGQVLRLQDRVSGDVVALMASYNTDSNERTRLLKEFSTGQ